MAQTFTRAHAETVAAVLKRLPYIKEVVLFGSIAQKGSGRDIDLALVVPTPFVMRFNMLIAEELQKKGMTAETRDETVISQVFEEAAIEVLGEGLRHLLKAAKALLPPHEDPSLDLILVPYEWRVVAPQIRKLGPAEDRHWGDIERGVVL